MMQQSYANGGTCCFTDRMSAVDPTTVDNVVPAGAVSSADLCGMPGGGGCAPATVYFPTQEYRAGFCPSAALARGTLFPELVSDYPNCRNREVSHD